MSKITDSARMEECTVRLPSLCNFNPETTVAAHYSLSDLSGKSTKTPDPIIAYSCSDCHDAIDGRRHKDKLGNELKRESVRLAHAEGVFRTIVILKRKGLVK